MFRTNDCIGPYQLIEKIGEGSFAEVWLAEKLNAIAPRCAIKLPRSGAEAEFDEEIVINEARLWVQANGHPNVLTIIESNIYEGQLAIVSEYARDGSLFKWLRQHSGRAPAVEAAVEMMSGILAGLEHIHRQGIIHRDLKPGNILLQGDIPRIADFGVSRVLSSTQNTIFAGTFAYAAPEAFDGKRTVQTDLWSAGVLLYQLLSGSLPFPQKEPLSLMKTIVNGEPDSLPSSLPGSLQAVIRRALEKEPTRRFESAAQMRQALRETRQQPEPKPEPPRRSPDGPDRVVIPLTPPPKPALPSFEFTTVTLDAKGKVIERLKGQAHYFTEDLGDGIEMEMVEIPGGTFTMGSTKREVQAAFAVAKCYRKDAKLEWYSYG